jgi:hypothetical protein
VEKYPNGGFNYCTVESGKKDAMKFLDYLAKPKGDHHDFYGNSHYFNVICDIARGADISGENDLEVAAQMVRMGYVVHDNGKYRSATVVYTAEQYEKAADMVREFVKNNLSEEISALEKEERRVLAEHTPKRLRNQVAGISRMVGFDDTVSAPAKILVDRGYLSTDWNPNEMPTTYIVLG